MLSLSELKPNQPVRVADVSRFASLKSPLVIFLGTSAGFKAEKPFAMVAEPALGRFFTRAGQIPVDEKLFEALADDEAQALLTHYKIAGQGIKVENGLGCLPMSLGTDPEMFVVDSRNRVVPAFLFLPDKPALSPQYRGGTPAPLANNPVYWDGFQAEFMTEPGTCLAYHIDSIRHGLIRLHNATQQMQAGLAENPKLSIASVVEIPLELLEKSAQKHVALGCDPSLNAYGMTGEPVVDPRKFFVRMAGGHVHLGVGGALTPKQIQDVVMAIDAIVGTFTVGMFASFDKPIRRKYYGLAGEYRLPPHGIEYRTLSNAWLMHPGIANLCIDLVRASARLGFSKVFHDCWQGSPQETVETINNCDVKAARAIVERNKDLYAHLFTGIYRNTTQVGLAAAFKAAMSGVESIVRNPEDVPGNWQFRSAWNHSTGEGGTGQWQICSEKLTGGVLL